MGNCYCGVQKDYPYFEEKIDFGDGNVHVITRRESWDGKISEANRDGKIIIANFSASWCGPCRQIAPLYVELSKKNPQLVFLTVDVDELTDLSSSWEIRATPTFFFLKDGQQLDKLVGANKSELEKKIITFADFCHERIPDSMGSVVAQAEEEEEEFKGADAGFFYANG